MLQKLLLHKIAGQEKYLGVKRLVFETVNTPGERYVEPNKPKEGPKQMESVDSMQSRYKHAYLVANQYLDDLQAMLQMNRGMDADSANSQVKARPNESEEDRTSRQFGRTAAIEAFKQIQAKHDPDLVQSYLTKIESSKADIAKMSKPENFSAAVLASGEYATAEKTIQNLLAVGSRFPAEQPATPPDTAVARRAPAAPAPQPRTARPAPVAAAPVPTVGLGAVGIVRGPEVPREEVKPADALDAYGKEQLRNATNNPDKPTRFADITEENVNTRTFAGMPRVALNSPEYARIKQLTLNTVGEAALGHYLISNNNSVYYVKKGSGIFEVRKVS